MTSREELIEELSGLRKEVKYVYGPSTTEFSLEDIADFILDRERALIKGIIKVVDATIDSNNSPNCSQYSEGFVVGLTLMRGFLVKRFMDPKDWNNKEAPLGVKKG